VHTTQHAVRHWTASVALLYSFCICENHTFLSRTKLLMRPCASFCKLRYYLAQLYTAAHRCTHTQTDISVVISMIDSSFNSLVSRQASQHILRWSKNKPKNTDGCVVVARRPSGTKIPWGAWLGLLLLSSVWLLQTS